MAEGWPDSFASMAKEPCEGKVRATGSENSTGPGRASRGPWGIAAASWAMLTFRSANFAPAGKAVGGRHASIHKASHAG